MREHINQDIVIDGRKIPYRVFEASEYFELHDGINYLKHAREATETGTDRH